MGRFRLIGALLGMLLVIVALPLVVNAGWEWQNPLPQGNTLRAVWGSSATDVFAVGDAGTIVHYDGTTWSSMNTHWLSTSSRSLLRPTRPMKKLIAG